MPVLKIYRDDEVHRIGVDDVSLADFGSFLDLVGKVLHEDDDVAKSFLLTWRDEEGDKIKLDSTAALHEALRSSAQDGIFRVWATKQQQRKTPTTTPPTPATKGEEEQPGGRHHHHAGPQFRCGRRQFCQRPQQAPASDEPVAPQVHEVSQ